VNCAAEVAGTHLSRSLPPILIFTGAPCVPEESRTDIFDVKMYLRAQSPPKMAFWGLGEALSGEEMMEAVAASFVTSRSLERTLLESQK